MKRALGLSWWRFRSTLRVRRGGYLAIVLLIGALGGLAMGSVAGARRTQSAFPVYLASTNPSDVEFFTEFATVTRTGYSAKVDRAIAQLPYVKSSVDVIGFDGNLTPLGPLPADKVPGEAPPAFEGSLNGEYVTQDSVTVLEGRPANPSRQDEFVMSAPGAAGFGLHIGSSLPLGFYTDAQTESSSFRGYPTDKPHVSIDLKLVGIVESSNQVVQDDDAALGSQFAVLTPALTRRLAGCCAYYSYVALKLQGGSRHLGQVRSGVESLLPKLGPASGSQTYAPLVAKAERSIRPASIAFAVFGLIVALATLMVGAQLIGRMARRNSDDGGVLRALGATPLMSTVDGLIGVLGSVVAGSLLAVAVAVSLSPLAPFGSVRSVYPDQGVAFDWTVLGLGFALLLVLLSAAAVLMAYRVSPHRRALPGQPTGERGSSVARAASASGLPLAAVTGIRSALGVGSARDAAPMRSAMIGAVLAVVVVVTSVTFGASLTSLVSRPSHYGWNWNYALLSGFSGAEDLPGAQTAVLLNHDPDVAHWAPVYFEDARLDGQGVPVLATSPNAAVTATPLSGHPLQSPQQVVLGTATLAALHKHVGDTVVASTGGSRTFRLRIVGTATMPTIGGSGSPELQMGLGAVIASSLFPAQFLNLQGSAVPGPNAKLITIRPGISAQAALGSLQRIDKILNNSSDGPVGGVVSVLRPAEIANYGAVGSTPTWLAAILAAGAVGALGLTLVSSVRRRRRELALLKTLGFTRIQLAATVTWQSSVPAAVGVLFGMPLGIALGRWLWTLFARGISAVPDPTVPVVSMVLIGIGGLVFANLMAALPGRIAARTPTALALRSE